MLSEKKISAPKHKIICDNTLDALKRLPTESVDMIMTSPPYWSLRDYGEETAINWNDNGETWYGQLGLEPTPELYIKHLRDIFAEIKRVLKITGTCWVNIGDSYSNKDENNPSKCMVMIPERFAFMMIDLGYILRNKIIWHKPNPMPSSVKDRFNTTYEMLYLFSKSKKYWFDLDAVREEHKPESLKRIKGNWNGHREPMSSFQGMDIKKMCSPSGKNPGDIIEMSKEEWLEYCNYLWDLSNEYPDFFSINTQSFPEAHFAVFPTKLCEKPILAGCPAAVCKHCGIVRMRVTKKGDLVSSSPDIPMAIKPRSFAQNKLEKQNLPKDPWGSLPRRERETIGWTNCQCKGIDKYEPGVILDPFGGSGTISIEAEKLDRSSTIIEIKKEYCKMALKRLSKITSQAKLDGRRSIIECINF